MKKLFYIVLVIVILLVIGRFVKNSNQPEAVNVQEAVLSVDGQPVAEEIVVTPENPAIEVAPEAVAAPEPSAVNSENAPEPISAEPMEANDVPAPEVNESVEISNVDENVEEVNPSATQSEDETIVQE